MYRDFLYRKENNMKKTIAVLACAAALTMTAYASPQTDFTQGEWEVNAGMSHPEAKMGGYSSSSRWNFDGGVTYGLGDGYAVEFQHHGLDTKYIDGYSRELNLLYNVHPQVAVYGGYNRISMQNLPLGTTGSEDRDNNVLQLGVIARKPLTNGLDLYAKGALGTKNTSLWEAGVNYALDRNLDVNAGYRYLNTKGNSEKNATYQGWLAGVSYRFGSGHDRTIPYKEDYSYEKEDKTVVTVERTESEEVENKVVVPENDYYFNSIHFDNDSDTPRADQTANLDAFVKKAKETGHIFKLIGRTDSNGNKDYNDALAIRRVKKVADYAVSHGVNIDQLVGMYKGEEDPSDTNDTEQGRANNRRVDIFEHK